MGQAAVKKEGEEEKEDIFFIRGTEKVEFMIMVASVLFLALIYLELRTTNSKIGVIS